MDPEVVEQLAFNIGWHCALDIRDDSDCYICERTLRNYRRLVIENGLDEALFKGLTDGPIRAFSVDTSRQRIDSTAIRSAMRNMSRVETVVATMRTFLKECVRKAPEFSRKIEKEIVERYLKADGMGCFSFPSPSEAKRRLEEAGVDMLAPSSPM